MNFREIAVSLKTLGYSPRKAEAKIAHDIVLKAINDAGFHDQVTIKGGVVMSGLTDAVRRATIDMDFDFLGYSLGDTSIKRFINHLNRAAQCDIRLDGEIQELKQREYKGKRIGLVLTDEAGYSIKTKIDIGVHSNKSVEQVNFQFKIITENDNVVLLVNPKEQIFAEKLKSLLRLGIVSTRYKDVYDLFYLCQKIDIAVLREYLRIYIFNDKEMVEKNSHDIEVRLSSILSNKIFRKRMANPDYAWLDEPVESIISTLLNFVQML